MSNTYDTVGTRYVSVRSNGYHNGARYVAMRNSGTRYVPIRGSGARYVAVRYDDDLDRPKLKRYGSVYDVDYGDQPRRYVVRRPVYVEPAMRYVAVRRAEPRIRYMAIRTVVPASRYVAVRNIDIDDDDQPRYVAVRRQINYDPGVRYVAVRRQINYEPDVRYVAVRTEVPRTRFVAVRSVDSGCTRAVALRNCLDQVETMSKRHVVIRTDHLTGTQAVLYDTASDDDAYALQHESDETAIAVPQDDGNITYTDAAYSNGNSATYIAANDLDNQCVSRVAAVACQPEAVSTRMISYAPAYDDDEIYNTAILDNAGATYIAADNIGDACLSPVAVISPREVVSTRAVSYIPVEEVDDDASPGGSEATYIATKEAAAPAIKYVSADDDEIVDADATFVADDGVDATCLRQVAVRTCGDDVSTEAISYVPLDADENAETVSYVPIDETDVGSISYVPVDEVDMQNVSYVPVEDVEDADTEAVSYVPVDDTDATTG